MVAIVKKVLLALLLTILLLGVPRVSGMIADLFDYRAFDPDGAYAWISVHHIVQALVFLVIMAVVQTIRPMSFGFGWGNKAVGKRYVLKFALIFSVGSLATNLLMILAGMFQPFAYPMTANNIIGYLGFQLLLSGPSEELIFRAFAIVMLALAFKGQLLKSKVSVATLMAAVIFGVAHMHISLAPFSVRFSLLQVVLAFGLGIFYGDCFEKTGSMYYPMMMHSISNVVMVGYSVIATHILQR